eukprot:gi/632937243/ref/XP_007897820.1/ PREDICTED: uncharacterized protein LOC103182563 [Callorhinchus milii]
MAEKQPKLPKEEEEEEEEEEEKKVYLAGLGTSSPKPRQKYGGMFCNVEGAYENKTIDFDSLSVGRRSARGLSRPGGSHISMESDGMSETGSDISEMSGYSEPAGRGESGSNPLDQSLRTDRGGVPPDPHNQRERVEREGDFSERNPTQTVSSFTVILSRSPALNFIAIKFPGCSRSDPSRGPLNEVQVVFVCTVLECRRGSGNGSR